MPRLLLVEDNEMNRDMLSRRLRRQGYAVAIAIDGRQGLEKARIGGFDLILMDLSLPEIDGWEVTRLLKSDPSTRSTPIIALTAHAMAGDRERSFQAGCDDHEVKPIDFPRLLAKIESLLPTRAETMSLSVIEETEMPVDLGSISVSLLRHELITPITHILGFSELLIDEALQKGRSYRAQGLRSIRGTGKDVLHQVDLCFNNLSGPEEVAPNLLIKLARALLAPSSSIIEACKALEDASSEVPDRDDFLHDLARIRDAAARLAVMAGELTEPRVESKIPDNPTVTTIDSCPQPVMVPAHASGEV